MGKIVNHFAELLDAKRKASGESLNMQDVAYETKLAYGTLLKWQKNQVDRYDSATLATICEYLDCKVGDMLELVK